MKGYFDGASRGNPGAAGAGALIADDGGTAVWETSVHLGVRTNNEAEYLALLLLLEEADRRGIREMEVYGDSRLVISQVSRLWKINEPRLRELAERVWALCEGKTVRFVWIPRERNTRADALSNQALDGLKKQQAPVKWVHEGIALVKDPDGEVYAVDVRHRSCTCDRFGRAGICPHLDAARDRQMQK